MENVDQQTPEAPHGFWCVSRVTISGGLILLVTAVCVFVLLAGQPPIPQEGQGVSQGNAALRLRLTREQYHVACENGTEPPFHNAYWDNHAAGIYVDVITGKPLFSSLDKFNSGTGWPSFTKPIAPDSVVEKTDRSALMVRTEVRSKEGNTHLRHVFDDGPALGGQRYCINSASLRFIPADKLRGEGYAHYSE